MPGEDERLAAEVSRLYWETDASVGEIASQLDVSRRALYAALQPLPVGERCAECGAGLVFMTRSAREEGVAECPACGFEQRVAASAAGAAENGGWAGGGEGAPGARGAEAAPALPAARAAARGVLIAGVAGVVVGVVGTRLLLRR